MKCDYLYNRIAHFNDTVKYRSNGSLVRFEISERESELGYVFDKCHFSDKWRSDWSKPERRFRMAVEIPIGKEIANTRNGPRIQLNCPTLWKRINTVDYSEVPRKRHANAA